MQVPDVKCRPSTSVIPFLRSFLAVALPLLSFVIMASQPGQDWPGSELASRLGIKPQNLLTQLAEWTRLGFLSKTGRGRYALPGPAGPAGAATDSAGP